MCRSITFLIDLLILIIVFNLLINKIRTILIIYTICKCDDEINYMMRVVQIEKVYSKISNSLKNYVRFMFLINDYAMKIRNELIIHDIDLLIN